MSCFVESTGKTENAVCDVCRQVVAHEELRDQADGETSWRPLEHRAPCGAHCAGGGTDPDEPDVHIKAFGSCPRCGATETTIVHTVTAPDQTERVVFHRYIVDYHRDLGFRIELETRKGTDWIVKGRWPSNNAQSLQAATDWAKNYVKWLKDEGPNTASHGTGCARP